MYRKILEAVSNTDQSDEAAEASTSALETTIAESLTGFERTWPNVLVSGPVLHTLIHYPRLIHRWNSVRNYWCYFNERSAVTVRVRSLLSDVPTISCELLLYIYMCTTYVQIMRCCCCTLCAAHWTLCAVTAHYVLLPEHYVLLLRNISCSCRCLLISLREATSAG